jgi:hypothetical protein
MKIKYLMLGLYILLMGAAILFLKETKHVIIFCSLAVLSYLAFSVIDLKEFINNKFEK